MPYEAFFAPFVEYAFMRRALAGAIILSLSAGPVGVFLTLRRMSLAGDAMAHAILPGAAAGFLFGGLQILPMTLGGFVAGIAVAFSGRARFAVHHPARGFQPCGILSDFPCHLAWCW